MPYQEKSLPVLEAAITAMNRANNDLYTAGDGLSDAAVAAISSKGTVDKLLALILTFPWAERNHPHKDFIYSALYLAANPIFPLVTTVTSATGATTGGSLAAGTYEVRVTSFDRFGRESAPSVAITSTVASGSTGSIPVIMPSTPGAERFRVYYSNLNGVAGSEDRYLESAAGAAISGSPATVTITTVTVAGSVVAGTPPSVNNAGFGYLTDLMVETAQVAGSGNFALLRNALADQHPLGTSMRTYEGADGNFAYNAIP